MLGGVKHAKERITTVRGQNYFSRFEADRGGDAKARIEGKGRSPPGKRWTFPPRAPLFGWTSVVDGDGDGDGEGDGDGGRTTGETACIAGEDAKEDTMLWVHQLLPQRKRTTSFCTLLEENGTALLEGNSHDRYVTQGDKAVGVYSQSSCGVSLFVVKDVAGARSGEVFAGAPNDFPMCRSRHGGYSRNLRGVEHQLQASQAMGGSTNL